MEWNNGVLQAFCPEDVLIVGLIYADGFTKNGKTASLFSHYPAKTGYKKYC